MRRVTSFCVLVSSMLILIHGARSEHAFCQNDRLPNKSENDPEKFKKPEITNQLVHHENSSTGMKHNIEVVHQSQELIGFDSPQYNTKHNRRRIRNVVRRRLTIRESRQDKRTTLRSSRRRNKVLFRSRDNRQSILRTSRADTRYNQLSNRNSRRNVRPKSNERTSIVRSASNELSRHSRSRAREFLHDIQSNSYDDLSKKENRSSKGRQNRRDRHARNERHLTRYYQHRTINRVRRILKSERSISSSSRRLRRLRNNRGQRRQRTIDIRRSRVRYSSYREPSKDIADNSAFYLYPSTPGKPMASKLTNNNALTCTMNPVETIKHLDSMCPINTSSSECDMDAMVITEVTNVDDFATKAPHYTCLEHSSHIKRSSRVRLARRRLDRARHSRLVREVSGGSIRRNAEIQNFRKRRLLSRDKTDISKSRRTNVGNRYRYRKSVDEVRVNVRETKGRESRSNRKLEKRIRNQDTVREKTLMVLPSFEFEQTSSYKSRRRTRMNDQRRSTRRLRRRTFRYQLSRSNFKEIMEPISIGWKGTDVTLKNEVTFDRVTGKARMISPPQSKGHAFGSSEEGSAMERRRNGTSPIGYGWITDGWTREMLLGAVGLLGTHAVQSATTSSFSFGRLHFRPFIFT